MAHKKTVPKGGAIPVKSGTIFHYTSINVWICSAVKCAGYHSRKVENAGATWTEVGARFKFRT